MTATGKRREQGTFTSLRGGGRGGGRGGSGNIHKACKAEFREIIFNNESDLSAWIKQLLEWEMTSTVSVDSPNVWVALGESYIVL